jgi:hypothetical protein
MSSCCSSREESARRPWRHQRRHAGQVLPPLQLGGVFWGSSSPPEGAAGVDVDLDTLLFSPTCTGYGKSCLPYPRPPGWGLAPSPSSLAVVACTETVVGAARLLTLPRRHEGGRRWRFSLGPQRTRRRRRCVPRCAGTSASSLHMLTSSLYMPLLVADGNHCSAGRTRGRMSTFRQRVLNSRRAPMRSNIFVTTTHFERDIDSGN